MSSLFEQLDLAAWQHELRDAHGRWTRTGDMPAALQAKIKSRLAQQFGGTLAATGNWHWAGGKPQLGARVHDYHGNGGWVRGVTPGGWAAIEFDDQRRQVVRPDGTVLHDFYGWADEGDATDEQLRDFMDVESGKAPSPPPQPEDPAPDTEPPAEYGQNSQAVRELRKLLPEAMNADALPEDQPTESHKEGEVEIVTLGDGTKVLFKEQVPERNDKEELSYYIAQAMGKSIGKPPQLPAIARDPDNPWNLIEQVVPGTVGSRWLQEHLPAGAESEAAFTQLDEIEQKLLARTDEGREIGLLDYLVSNADRHSGNFIVDDQGKPHPIDMGEAQFDSVNYYNPFWDGSELGKPEAEDLEAELRKLQPEFDRLGHHDWYVIMMGRLHALTELASPPGNAIELATGLAYLHELRDKDGRWTRTPSDKSGKPGTPDRYKVPPHSRLINPRADIPDPADMPYFKKHPVSVQHIIDAYDAVPAEMKPDGMRWYADAHLLAKAIGNGDAEKGAILLANYSPQANWPINMFRAARVVEMGHPIPKGQGYISGDQVKKAQKALDGQHVDEVLTSPKTRSFAHLIAQGDDSPDDPYGHVVIDAHALNVAEGGTQRGATYKSDKARKKIPKEDLPPIGSDVRAHEYVADMYREAASIIAHRDGIAISPHQLQAVTWVAQVLANMAKDKAEMEGGATGGVLGRAKGRLSAKAKDWQTWLAWAKSHNIHLVPGVSALAVEALLAQIIELAGEDSVIAQLDMAAWEHELRGPDGRWIKSPSSASRSLVERQRAQPVTEGDLRLALIKSQVYTTQQFDHMQDEINRLQAELDQEGKDEAKAVLTTHLAWIGAGIAVALLATGIGLPPAVALLTATLPALGSEFSELAVVLGKGKHALAHPAEKIKQILQNHKPHLALATEPGLGQAALAVQQWLAQTGYDGPDAAQIAHVLVDSWASANQDTVAKLRDRNLTADSLAAQLLDFAVPSGGIGEQLLSVSTVSYDTPED